jgi:hypothetical protein
MGELIHEILLVLILFLPVLFLGAVIAIVVRSSGRASSDGRRSIMSVVPRPAKLIGSILLSIAVTVGVITGSLRPPHGPHAPILGGLLGLLGGTFVGGLFLLWVLGLGYVYGDARRRNMPAVPWLLVALLVPNLLGFLLYFVLRKPLARP